jgi:hypothetical protein
MFGTGQGSSQTRHCADGSYSFRPDTKTWKAMIEKGLQYWFDWCIQTFEKNTFIEQIRCRFYLYPTFVASNCGFQSAADVRTWGRASDQFVSASCRFRYIAKFIFHNFLLLREMFILLIEVPSTGYNLRCVVSPDYSPGIYISTWTNFRTL